MAEFSTKPQFTLLPELVKPVEVDVTMVVEAVLMESITSKNEKLLTPLGEKRHWVPVAVDLKFK